MKHSSDTALIADAVNLLRMFKRHICKADAQLKRTVHNIFKEYNLEAQVRYHKFKHALDIAQLIHYQISIIRIGDLSDFDKYFMIFAVLCHGIKHLSLDSLGIEKHKQDNTDAVCSVQIPLDLL